ncbi:KTSC domain-containing protein [Sphingomonas sp. PP-CC-3G-468]|uniref:KTSC domain-containing protein n=1 Tax=Sphingomonas sp. PP-CC-3G-468 TaxID=2135656 RepID=UPI001044D94C|nr:KTSC domain-containing protein [Sphingomonas sp. PP-CC-3G-468]
MQRQSVSSSNIASIGYDEPTSLLEVEFLNGGIYHYFNVPSFVYEQLISAPSHGIYLNTNIKPNYQCARV